MPHLFLTSEQTKNKKANNAQLVESWLLQDDDDDDDAKSNFESGSEQGNNNG